MKHPHIFTLYQLYQKETQPFRKVHRMIDLFESIIKTHTVVIIAEYVKHNTLSDSAKGLLAQGLRTPSLGTWQLFSRVLFTELQLSSYKWLIDELQLEFILSDNELASQLENGTLIFPTFDNQKIQLLKRERKQRKSTFDEVISLRNSYAHGATPTDEQCEADINKFEPFLKQLLALKWLNASDLEVRDNKVYLVTNEGELALHPLLLYREEESAVSFAFFNDIKRDKIGLLNYPLSKHYREKDFYTEFHEHLPLQEWKKSGNNVFYQRIEELTETFKGRTTERKQLLRFVEDKSKGYFSIQGNPGIGKSALIAQFFKDVRANEKLKHIRVVEYFIRRGTTQANIDYLLNYLIKRTEELFPQGRDIRAEGKMTFDIQQQLFNKWRLWSEHSKGDKLLFLIDGLDEGVEDDLVKYLPRENFENILIIYGSRPGGHRNIDELWATLPTEYHTKLELTGLSKEDIRALIYEVANKYELEKVSPWIDAVQQRSQGNPLYLKLLCDSLENGSIALNDTKALPKEIDDYYKAILQRYAHDTLDGDALLAGLYTFAAAKDYLTFSHVSLINQLGEAQMERVGSILKEVLYENPLTENVLDYQLFHESFREYLIKTKTLSIKNAEKNILNFCEKWEDYSGIWEQRYVLENYGFHLANYDSEDTKEQLFALAKNKSFQDKQIKELKNYESSKLLQRQCLKIAHKYRESEIAINNAIELIRINTEEKNNINEILQMVSNNDIKNVLIRINSIGGNNPSDKVRQFLVYMLCIQELTLGDSKHKYFAKEALINLLENFDENVITDTSILDWKSFYPSNLMFKIVVELDKYGIDFTPFFTRTIEDSRSQYKDNNILNDAEPFTFQELRVLKQLNLLEDLNINSNIELLVKNKRLDDALFFLDETKRNKEMDIIITPENRINILKEIAVQFANDNNLNKSRKIFTEAILLAKNQNNEILKASALINLALVIQPFESEMEIQSILDDILKILNSLPNEENKFDILLKISTLIHKNQHVILHEALFVAKKITEKTIKLNCLLSIFTRTINNQYSEDFTFLKGDIYSLLEEIIEDNANYLKVLEILSSFLEHGLIEVNNPILKKVVYKFINKSFDTSEIKNLEEVALNFILLGFVDEGFDIIESFFTFNNSKWKRVYIIYLLSTKGKTAEIFDILIKLLNHGDKLPQFVFDHLIKCTNNPETLSRIIELLNSFEIELRLKNLVLKNISNKMIFFGELHKALEIARRIDHNSVERFYAIEGILIEYLKQNNLIEFNNLLNELLNLLNTSRTINQYKLSKKLSHDLIRYGEIDSLIKGFRKMYGIFFPDIIVCAINTELIKSGLIQECNAIYLEVLSTDYLKNENKFWIFNPILNIIKDLSSLNNNDKIDHVLEGAFKIANDNLKNQTNRVSDIQKLVFEYTQLGKIQEALIIARGVSNDKIKLNCFLEIVRSLIEQKKQEETEKVLNEAKYLALDLSDIKFKINKLFFIAEFYIKNGNSNVNQSILKDLLVIAEKIKNKEEYFETVCKILIKLNNIEKAISIFKEIKSRNAKNNTIKRILNWLSKNGKWKEFELFKNEILNEITTSTKIINDKYLYDIYLIIATEYANYGFFIESIDVTDKILDEEAKSLILSEISNISYKNNKLSDAEFALNQALIISNNIINDTRSISNCFSEIAIQFLKQEKYEMAFLVAHQIPLAKHRRLCWMKLGELYADMNSINMALEKIELITSDDDSINWINGACSNLKPSKSSSDEILNILFYISNDISSLTKVLYFHSAYCVFFSNSSNEKIDRLNKILDIKWMQNLLSKSLEEIQRLSTNVEEWLHEIADEDDRDDVLDWAKRVKEGKWTEEKFQEKIQEKIK